MSLIELSKRPVQPLIVAAIEKKSVDDVIGITLNYFDGGKIIIRNVAEDSLFAATDLKAGLVLVSVNDTEVKGMSTPDAMALFLEAEGALEVVAEDVGLKIASVSKETIDSKVGISLKKFGKKTIISAISDSSLLADSDLKVGLTLLGVNGTSCKNLTIVQAIALFKELQDITVHAQENGLISVKVEKESVDTKVGIGLKVIKGNIIISAISEDSLFADTDICPGLRLLAANKVWCDDGITKTAAIAPFKEAEGSITVLAQNIGYICGTAVKESVDTKVGIALNEYEGGVIISSIAEGGLFDETDLQIGLRLVCINSTMLGAMGKKEAIGLFKEAEGKVTVIAERIGLVVASNVKDLPDSKVGISLKEYNGMIIISGVSEEGIFYGSALKVGLKLVSVNKTNVTGMTKNEAIGLFKDAEGEVVVMAQEVGLFGASVTKDSAETKVGIGLKEVDGGVVVSSVYASGLFIDTDIKEGQRLVSVNRKSVAGMSRKEAIMLFKEAEGEINVVAEKV